MRLILIRHGESEWNRDGRIMGRADVELTGLGQRQAHALAKALQGEKIEVVYCSPLRRAMDTARRISNDQGCLVIPDPDLEELGRGNLEGMTRQEAFLKYPGLERIWPNVCGMAGLRGQESLEHFRLRVESSLNRIKAEHDEGTVVLVGHYFVNLVILLSALDMELGYLRNFGQDLAAISVVEIEGNRSTICLFNDTCHLRKG